MRTPDFGHGGGVRLRVNGETSGSGAARSVFCRCIKERLKHAAGYGSGV